MQAYVQIHQRGPRTLNLQATYPPASLTDRDNPYGVFFTASACATNQTVLRDFVVSGVVGRDGAVTGPRDAAESERQNHRPPAWAHDIAGPERDEDAVGGASDPADVEDRPTQPCGGTDSGCVHATVAEVPCGVGTVRVLDGATEAASVTVTAFASSVDATDRPGAHGEAVGFGLADPHAHAAATGVAKLAEALVRSSYEASFKALMGAVLAAPMQPAPAPHHLDPAVAADGRRDTAPAFVCDWAFPLAPTFVASTQRVPRRSGARAVLASAGRPIAPAARMAVTSAADLLSVLDAHCAAAVAQTLLNRRGAQPTHEPLANESERVAMAAEDPARDATAELHAAILAKHVAFAALFSDVGLLRVHGDAFFRHLSHADRMVVAAFAMCATMEASASATAEPGATVPPTPAFSPREGDGAATSGPPVHPAVSPDAGGARDVSSTELPWSFVASCGNPEAGASERRQCTLIAVRLGDGITYVACVLTPKRGPLIASKVAGLRKRLTARLAVDLAGDARPLAAFEQQGTAAAVGAAGGGCCTTEQPLRFCDLSEVSHRQPGLITAHISRLRDVYDLGLTTSQFATPVDGRLPRGLDGEDLAVMLDGLESLRVIVRACPPLAAAASRATPGTDGIALVSAARNGQLKLQRDALDLTMAQEWAGRPEPECAFVVCFNRLGAFGAQSQVSPAATLRRLPANVRAPFRGDLVDTTNRHESPMPSVVVASGAGHLTGSFVYDAPTPAYVASWPPEPLTDESERDARDLGERVANAYLRTQQACAQTACTWGMTSVEALTRSCGAGVSCANAAARLWARQLAIVDDSILRSAVNAAYRPFAKRVRASSSDDDDSDSTASTPDLSDFDESD